MHHNKSTETSNDILTFSFRCYQLIQGNPEFMEIFQDERMQGYIKAMVTEGEEGVKEKIKQDTGAKELIEKLQSIMASHAEL